MNKARAISVVARYSNKPSERWLIASRNKCFGMSYRTRLRREQPICHEFWPAKPRRISDKSIRYCDVFFWCMHMSTDNASDKDTRNNWSENFLQRFAWWKRNSGRVFKTY